MDNEKLDKEYAKTGARALATLDNIRSLITDYPADSSCGAGWPELTDLFHVLQNLLDVERTLENSDA